MLKRDEVKCGETETRGTRLRVPHWDAAATSAETTKNKIQADKWQECLGFCMPGALMFYCTYSGLGEEDSY